MPVSMYLDAYLAGLVVLAIELGAQFKEPNRALVALPGVNKFKWVVIPASVTVDPQNLPLAACLQ